MMATSFTDLVWGHVQKKRGTNLNGASDTELKILTVSEQKAHFCILLLN